MFSCLEISLLLRVDPTAIPNGEGNFQWKPLLIAAKWANIEILKEFAKLKTPWTVEAFGENILTLLLTGCDECANSKKCLLWLKNEIDPDLKRIVNTIGNSGSSALSLVSQFDWDGDDEKDQMIGWLLRKGADITLMDPRDAEAYLDRYRDKDLTVLILVTGASHLKVNLVKATLK